MFVKTVVLGSNPFFLAFNHSDFLGKLIYISLIATSICCWIILIHKFWLTLQARKHSVSFEKAFSKQKNKPLDIENEAFFKKDALNPFYQLYVVLKKHTIDILNKNHRFGSQGKETSYLSPADIDYIESHLLATIASQTKNLGKNLYILFTIVGLAPLLGLGSTRRI